MLKVIVHNAESVPNLERFTNVDPMVTLIFQGRTKSLSLSPSDNRVFSGITKETNWQRSTGDPKWEEVILGECLERESLVAVFRHWNIL